MDNINLALCTLRVERSVSFQALLDSFHVEGPLLFRIYFVVPLELNLNMSSLVLRYFARRLAFFFS